MNSNHLLLAATMTCLALLPAVVAAQTNQSNTLLSWSGAPTTPRSGFNGTVGSVIAIGSTPLTINALGVQDGGLFLGTATEVGLWTADGLTLLASTTVSTSDPELAGNYRYQSIPTLTLAANTDYLIGALVGSGYTEFGDNDTTAPYSANSDVTIVDNSYASSGSSLAAPTSNGTDALGRWAPANATFLQVVPEPSVLAMSALGGLAIMRKCRRQK
jgi:hypothetical protein